MSSILAFIARKIGWFVVAFIIVLVGLQFAPTLWDKGNTARLAAARSIEAGKNARLVVGTMEQRQADFGVGLRKSSLSADREAASLSTMARDRVAAEEQRLGLLLVEARKRVLSGGQIALAVATGNADSVVASIRAEHVEIPLLERSLSVAVARKGLLRSIASRSRDFTKYRSSLDAFRQARAKHLRERTRLIQRKTALDQNSSAFSCRQLRLNCPNRAIERYNAKAATFKREAIGLNRWQQRLDTWRSGLVGAKLVSGRIESSRPVVDAAIEAYQSELKRTREAAQSYAVNQSRSALYNKGWTAFWIVLGAMAAPLLWKLFAFVVIAPYAAQARPIRLSPTRLPLSASTSHTAITVALERDSELLLRAGAQSGSAKLTGTDKLVLDWCMPLASVAAGLVSLQRLRTDSSELVTVTSREHDHFEVALLEVPEGGAVVLQPRALVGVLKSRTRSLRITRPWRLGSLGSWLTFRFRFIVFHGPCSLIVQGRRGVAVDYAGPGRWVGRRLTLGWETGVEYGSRRSTSFFPYLRGEASLFDDQFSGDGCYIHEHRPSVGGTGTIWGRGFKGLGDAVLKAFGI